MVVGASCGFGWGPRRRRWAQPALRGREAMGLLLLPGPRGVRWPTVQHRLVVCSTGACLSKFLFVYGRRGAFL